MKLCSHHYAKLREAIDARGLGHLVSANENDLKEKINKEAAGYVEGGPMIGATDPLLGAVWGIYANALRAGGVYLLLNKEDGSEYCPLCELEEKTESKAQDWIEAASNESLNFARKSGQINGSVN